jgi:8-oxo-dGTP pyrophosphatase MutT (NUDIX family)
VASEIRDAASVILVRPRDGGGPLEVFLLRRHKRSGFMASAFVFPGGIAEPSDTGPRNTAARELFEEAGILIGAALEPEDREAIRERAVAGGDANALLAEAGAPSTSTRFTTTPTGSPRASSRDATRRGFTSPGCRPGSSRGSTTSRPSSSCG